MTSLWLEPVADGSSWQAQCCGLIQGWTDAVRHRLLVVDKPYPVQPVFLAPQRLAQLALQIEVILATLLARGIAGADQQPLPFEALQAYAAPVQRLRLRIRQVGLVCNQLTKAALLCGPQHVIGEVRSHHGRRAHQQHRQHLPAATARALLAHMALCGVWLAVHRKAQRLIVMTGRLLCQRGAGGKSVGRVETRHRAAPPKH